MDDERALLENLASLQKVRTIVVYIALGLIVVSLVQRMPPIIYARVAFWAIAGIVSVLEARTLTKLGKPAGRTWFNAALYFAVALIPLLTLR